MLFTKKCVFDDGLPGGERNFAKDPAVINLDGTYFLYFSAYDNSDRKKLRIGIAQSSDMESWNFITLLPIEGECEKNGVGAPAAFLKNGTVHLFYQTYGNGKKDAICHAFSKDGINFERDSTNPIFSPSTDWCCGRAIDADVVEFNDKLFLYFATRDSEFIKQMVGVAYCDINSDYSKQTWTQGKNSPCVAPELSWEKNCIEAPATVVDDGKIYMFYGGAYNCEPQQIGVAVSDNGIDFVRLSDEPFMKNGNKGEWNESESGHPYVFKDIDSKVYLFFQGSPDKGENWYLSKFQIDFADGKPVII